LSLGFGYTGFVQQRPFGLTAPNEGLLPVPEATRSRTPSPTLSIYHSARSSVNTYHTASSSPHFPYFVPIVVSSRNTSDFDLFYDLYEPPSRTPSPIPIPPPRDLLPSPPPNTRVPNQSLTNPYPFVDRIRYIYAFGYRFAETFQVEYHIYRVSPLSSYFRTITIIHEYVIFASWVREELWTEVASPHTQWEDRLFENFPLEEAVEIIQQRAEAEEQINNPFFARFEGGPLDHGGDRFLTRYFNFHPERDYQEDISPDPF
jgi:hypothetical protein